MSESKFSIQPRETFEPSKAGAWAGIPMAEYHALPGESNSLLALLEKDPRQYQLARAGKLRRHETRDMMLGTMLHTIVNEGGVPAYHLRPETYGPEKKKWIASANECKAWLKAHADKPVLDGDDVAMLEAVTRCVRENKKAMKLIAGATPEVSAFARNEDLELPYLLRVRFDLLGRDDRGWYFVDTKSTRDASTDAFMREIGKRQYYAQLALYRRVLRRLTGEKEVRAYLLPIEKSTEFPRVNPRLLVGTALDEGDKVIDERLRLLKRCRLADRYPAFSDDEGQDEIQTIDLPPYYYDDGDDEITVE